MHKRFSLDKKAWRMFWKTPIQDFLSLPFALTPLLQRSAAFLQKTFEALLHLVILNLSSRLLIIFNFFFLFFFFAKKKQKSFKIERPTLSESFDLSSS